MLQAASRERDRYGIGVRQRMMAAPVQASSFVNLGPDRADFDFNGAQYFETDSGRARQILPHPWNKDILYLSTAGGGVWKSFDAGAGWEPITDALGSTAIGALAMDPSNPDILYLGFGDPFDVRQPGLTRSTDAGATWSDAVALVATVGGAQVTASTVTDIKVDPRNSAVVLATTDVGLFRSTDGGATWQPAALATPTPTETFFFVWSLAWTGNDTWLATGEVADPTQPTSASKNAGRFTLWRSTDDGATWTWNGGALPGGDAQTLLIGRATLAVAPSTVGEPATSRVFLLAGSLQGDGTYDLFRSDDAGLGFLGVGLNSKGTPTNPNANQPSLDVLHQQAWYNQALAVDPRNPDLVLVGGDLSLLQSADGGVTWSVLSNWLPVPQDLTMPYIHADLHSLAFGADGTFYAGSDGGIAVSTTVGTARVSFSSKLNQGLVTHLVYSVACAPEGWPPEMQGFVAGGMQDNGTRVRVGASTTFNQLLGGDGIGVAVSADTGQLKDGTLVPKVLVASSEFKLFRSNDGGQNWAAQTSGTTNQLRAVWLADANTGTVVGDQGTILRTTDGGQNWASQVSGVSEILLGVSFTDASNGTAVGQLGTIVRTTDGGQTWTREESGTNQDLYNVSFIDTNTGNAVGGFGAILRTSAQGPTPTPSPTLTPTTTPTPTPSSTPRGTPVPRQRPTPVPRPTP